MTNPSQGKIHESESFWQLAFETVKFYLNNGGFWYTFLVHVIDQINNIAVYTKIDTGQYVEKACLKRINLLIYPNSKPN